MLSASMWDFIKPSMSIQQMADLAGTRKTPCVYDSRAADFCASTKEFTVKDFREYVKCGGTWAYDYLNIHGKSSNTKPVIWRVK